MKNKPTKHEGILAVRLTALWPKLFRPQWVIGDCVADFFSPLLSLAIEVDGKSHASNKGKSNDLIKQDAYSQRNIRVLRFTNQQVEKHTDEVMAEIESVVASIVPSNTKRLKWAWTATGLPREIRRKDRLLHAQNRMGI